MKLGSLLSTFFGEKSHKQYPHGHIPLKTFNIIRYLNFGDCSGLFSGHNHVETIEDRPYGTWFVDTRGTRVGISPKKFFNFNEHFNDVNTILIITKYPLPGILYLAPIEAPERIGSNLRIPERARDVFLRLLENDEQKYVFRTQFKDLGVITFDVKHPRYLYRPDEPLQVRIYNSLDDLKAHTH